MMNKLRTVLVFSKVNTARFFRDPLALFFTIAFPLIFLFVFGGLFGNSSATFRIALINQADSEFATQYVDQVKKADVFKVNTDITTVDQAKERMNRGELDATVILPADFGKVKDGQPYPSGQLQVEYTQNNQQAGQALAAALDSQFKELNARFVKVDEPFTVKSEQTNDRSLKQFDYTFAGLMGFSLLGLGIFGPVNVFPELKRQGVLRRFSTTPLRVWQYFLSNVITQAVVGLFTLGVLFTVAITVFHLNVVGNIAELAVFIVLSIITLLGIGLALGGWAKNARQAAPLANLVTFPMMFLSGTFFPRFLMPTWLQGLSAFLPLTPMIDGIRLIVTEGKHLVDLLPQLGIIGVWMIIVYVIAFRVFRWE